MAGFSNREIETRGTPLAVELRRSASSRAIGGYGALFGRASRDMGGFVEVIEKSAFNRSQNDGYPGVLCRFEHEALLGTTAAGTLQLCTDATGLDYTCDVAPTTDGDNALALIGRGDIRSSSFAFQTMEQAWSHEANLPVRHLVSVRLVDCSPVAIPAYEDATVALRSLGIQFDAPPEEIFDMARDKQLSKLFCRTDNRGPQHNGAQSLKKLMAQTTDERRRRSWRQAQVELMGMVLDPATNRPYHEPLTSKQKQLAVLAAQINPTTGSPYGECKTILDKVIETQRMYKP